jgi:hypothetical protein
VRSVITGLMFAAMVAITLAAAVRVVRQPLPATVPQRDLWAWLTESDIGQESPETRQWLARRVDDELMAHADWPARLNRLDGQKQQLLQANLMQLVEVWYLHKVDQYFDQPEDQRAAFLDRELDKIDRLTERHSSSRGLRRSPAVAIFALGAADSRINEMVSRAEPQMQPRLREFQVAVRNRILARGLQQAAGL